MKIKIISTILVTLVMTLAICLLFIHPSKQSSGEVSIWFKDKDGILIIEEKVSFTKEDTLKTLLKENFQAEFQLHGTEVLIGLMGVTTDFVSNYIYITVNGAYSTKGVLEPLIDQYTYGFEVKTI